MARGMTLDDAMAECERWFSHLQRQRDKSIGLQEIAAKRRAGTMTLDEARRMQRQLDGGGVKVYDGANLEKAVRVLLEHVRN